MAEQLDSDRARPSDANRTILFIGMLVVVTLAFTILGGSQKDTTNAGAGIMTGQQGLKVGVEEATSHPQEVLPR